jgi:hypothetical protein
LIDRDLEVVIAIGGAHATAKFAFSFENGQMEGLVRAVAGIIRMCDFVDNPTNASS